MLNLITSKLPYQPTSYLRPISDFILPYTSVRPLSRSKSWDIVQEAVRLQRPVHRQRNSQIRGCSSSALYDQEYQII
jgi:hypothetical protein